MVATVSDYPWSSYPERVGLKERKLLDLDSCYEGLGDTKKQQLSCYCNFLEEEVTMEEARRIRDGFQRNQLTGDLRFVDEIESRIGLRVENRGGGRPRIEKK